MKGYEMKREPLLTIGSITALVAAVIAVATAFGLDLTADQEVALMGLVAVVAPFTVAILGRTRVTPVEQGDEDE